MLKAMHFHEGKAKRIEPGFKTRSGFVWLDYTNPTKEILRDISKEHGISMAELEDSLDEHERARVRSHKDYHLILYKIPSIDKEFQVKTVGIFWIKNIVITIHKGELNMPTSLYESSQRISSPAMFIHYVLDCITNSCFRALEKVEENIEKLEEKVVKTSSRVHTKAIFDIKKPLIYFHKAILANREALVSIRESQAFAMKKEERVHFNYLYNDTVQLLDLAAIHSEIMSTIMETDVSSTSNALGEVMKKLTVIASYALVPTLIASIYGMNFRPNSPFNMPELDWFFGYPFSLGLMGLSILSMRYYFKRHGWM